MDATDHERSCEAHIPITVLSTHGSGTQAVSFQPLGGAAGNEAVCTEAVAPPWVVTPSLFQVRCGFLDVVTQFCAHHRTISRCGFGGTNTHSP